MRGKLKEEGLNYFAICFDHSNIYAQFEWPAPNQKNDPFKLCALETPAGKIFMAIVNSPNGYIDKFTDLNLDKETIRKRQADINKEFSAFTSGENKMLIINTKGILHFSESFDVYDLVRGTHKKISSKTPSN